MKLSIAFSGIWSLQTIPRQRHLWQPGCALITWQRPPGKALLPASPDSLNDFPGISGEIPTLRQLANLDTDNDAVLRARERISAIEQLASQSSELARMEYDFLFDKECHLLTIGYNVVEHRRDPRYYDLFASEARLCSFTAIAQGQLPQESWFALGRLLTTTR